MTGPTQPTPRPLPNPGPPPAPGAEMTQPGPGPKPDGPTGPTPTGPGRLPRLGEVIRDVERTLTQAITTLGRQYDPASGPSQEDDPWGPEAVDIHLGSAVADIRSALRELDAVTLLGLPPVGSAVQYPARQAPSACLSGGSASHPVRRPGEGLLPGLASAGSAGQASTRIDRAVVAPVEGANHLAAAAASGGLLPGLADAAPTLSDIDQSVAPGAGESSDPGLRLSQRAPVGNGVRPGVGFTLPQAKRWTA